MDRRTESEKAADEAKRKRVELLYFERLKNENDGQAARTRGRATKGPKGPKGLTAPFPSSVVREQAPALPDIDTRDAGHDAGQLAEMEVGSLKVWSPNRSSLASLPPPSSPSSPRLSPITRWS